MNVFEEVKKRVSIEQAIESTGIKIKKGHFICPFHDDTHPSCCIKRDYFHCFVCGSGGDCITFTAKFFKLRNFDAAKKLIDDFKLDIPLEQELTTIEKLKAKRALADRQRKIKDQEEVEKLVEWTGRVLAEIHCILRNDKLDYPFEDIRHQRAVANLPQITYRLQCYDEDPEGFSLAARNEVKKLEGILHYFYDKD